MALHEFPAGDTGHLHVLDCPCKPGTKRRRRLDGFLGEVITHGQLPAAAAAEDLDEWQRVAATLPAGYRLAPAEDPEMGAEADCGHVVVETDGGEWQHHAIPDDSAPHAPTSECGCGPQRETSDAGRIVYVHTDQDDDQDDDEDWGGPQ